MMTKAEALKAIRNARVVFGWVKVTENDARYLRLYKNDVTQWIAVQDSNELNVTTTVGGAVWLD